MERKQLITTLVVLFLCIGTSCFGQDRTIKKLKRDSTRISILKPGKNILKDASGNKAARLIDFNNAKADTLGGSSVETSWEDMQQGIVMSYNLDQVTVVSKSRQVAERNGKVNVDFIISVPKKMLDSKYLVNIAPRLSRSGDSSVVNLDNILLYGKQFKKKQQNGYDRYQRYLNSIKGDSLDFLRAFTNKRLYDITLQRKQMQLNKKSARAENKETNANNYEALLEERINHYNRYPIYSMYKRGVSGVWSQYEKLRYLGLSTSKSGLPVNYMMREVRTNAESHRDKFHLWGQEPEYPANELSRFDSLYWRDFYTRYGEIVRNEWLKSRKDERFARYVKFPRNNVSRLDSVIDNGKDFKYYYSYDALVNENSRKLYLNVSGEVISADGRKYRIPDTDTITYYVSSIVQFTDHAPRFRKKILERKATANTIANIIFEKNRNIVKEEIGDNKAQLQRIQEIIRKLDESGEFTLDSITVTASSSPEGTWAHNAALAHKRSLALVDYFANRQSEDTRLSNFIKSRSVPENWDYLKKLIFENDTVKNKQEILRLISSEANPDKRETKIRNQFPQDYSYIVETMYPKLRNIHFAFNMHRRGMVKDTVQTTEPDTEYAEAVQKMEERKYKEALTTLINYSDRNTAICYMSMGYDDAAIGILLNEKEDADSQYLLSVLFSRKGNNEKGVKYFLRSVELDRSKVWRGALDPEINKLIEMYNLNEKLVE